MKRRPVVMLLVALGCGGASALLSLRIMRAQSAPPAASPASSSMVAVAARDLPGGAVLGAGDLRLVRWPAEALPSGFVGRVEDAVGHGIRAPLLANEPVLASKLAGRGVGGLPAAIPAGMRAISVKVDEVVAVAGFAVPGTRVDVVVTLADAGTGGGVARAALQNVEVLAAGQSREAAGDAEPQKATVITLLVTPEQAEVLALASAEGQIQLALRNTMDQSIAQTQGAVTAGLAGSKPAGRSSSPPTPATPAQPRRAHSPAVEIYHGSSRTVASF